MLHKNARRIKNILDGKYTERNTISTGYEKEEIVHKDGDTWIDELGKKWILKNGIKRNISKLSAVRKSMRLPYVCPECNQPMQHSLDNKFWAISGKCFSCVINEDTSKMIKGDFHIHEDKKIRNNIVAWFTQYEAEINEYIKTSDMNQFISEAGDIEDWSSSISKDKLKEIFDEQLGILKKNLKI